uniref:NADH-ubiquinone oxidoreductase chain 4L n=4 Tax=Kaburagia rhusicola TaxID=384835 RepID=A0A1Z1MWG1_9HEMI|nr:NADH dehydrogenase subunit 4L [Kaburagia rhusicola ovogallis]ARW70294.1 NADH dehydrogenase subunit 4L [Kaburagia rhusicola ensigallis]ARW70307.1 NADH dehydrogenase subunit 4L [Kaburagia rhusicola ovatirhusicola]ARW70333.1 NADH dehydrogenase subunit 4L [Kaburagia rhusicola rhusicola]ARW70320.1 NADH dehydrogenase subunit 4L [Kaburagia rhusicola ovogallis]UIE11122.1 NADH dehydrogenase subunit 4L [Kaburagia rhusicola ovogallis]
MMSLFMLIMLFMMFSGVLFYIFNFNHLLMMLLGLEYMLLILSLMFLMNFMIFIKQYILLLIFLIFCISESVLGLTILIMMVRMYGNDYLKSLMILQC